MATLIKHAWLGRSMLHNSRRHWQMQAHQLNTLSASVSSRRSRRHWHTMMTSRLTTRSLSKKNSISWMKQLHHLSARLCSIQNRTRTLRLWSSKKHSKFIKVRWVISKCCARIANRTFSNLLKLSISLCNKPSKQLTIQIPRFKSFHPATSQRWRTSVIMKSHLRLCQQKFQCFKFLRKAKKSSWTRPNSISKVNHALILQDSLVSTT